jgi:hypothetical protein
MAYIGVSPQNGVRKKHTYTASGSQTSFTGAGAEGITLSYKDSNFVDVYQNGVKLAEADYTSTSGTTIVLAQGAAANDIVEIIVYDVFSTSDMVSASDGGTFAGNVAMSGTLTLTGNGDFNGDLDVDGTLETDALTINGVTLAETISDTVGAMVSGNTETGITVTYQDGDNTLDFVVGTLNQDTTGTAANATLAATVTVTDSNANTNFPIVFHDESNALLDDTGALRYNPSTGELLVPKLTVAGTTTTVDTVTMNAANAVVFEGASANDHETTLTIVDPTADRTINLPNVSGTIPVLAAASNTAITSTPAEINLLDGSVANTVVNSKAVIYGSSGELAGALSTAAQPNVTSLGTLTTLTVDDITINGSTISDSGDFTLDIGGDIILDADGKDYLFKDGGTLICTMSSDNTDFTIRSEVQDRDLKFEGNDNGSVITALTLDMSAAGAATFNSTIGTPAGSASAPSHTFSSDTNTGMFKRGTDQIGFTAGGTEALAITSGGIFADTIGNKTSNGDLTLNVAGDIILDADGGDIRLSDAGTQFGKFTNSSSDFIISSSVNDKDMKFAGADGGADITALTLDMSDSGRAKFNARVNINGASDNGILTVAANTTAMTTNTNHQITLENTSQTSDAKGIISYKTNSDSGASFTPVAFGGITVNPANATRTGAFCVYVGDTDNVALGTDERLRVTHEGNVGINTSSPIAALHARGTDALDQLIVGNTTENTQFRVRVLQDDQVRLYSRDGDSARVMAFYTGTSERMRLRTDGQVAINTTGGSAQFQVLASSGDIVYFQNSSGTGAKLTAGNQSFSAVSDENKKESIVELDKQQSYDNIKNIRAVTYKFKDIEITDDDGKKTTYEDDKSRIGFIAQDWETKYSQLVNTDDDGVKSLLYTETTPVLLSALQKAQEKIEALEARITALESA